MSKRTIEITGKYLQIPVRMRQEKKPVHFYCEGEKILELAVCVGESDWNNNEFDYYGQIPVLAYQGKMVEIEGDVPEGLLEKICCGNELIINDEKKPSYHLTPNVGWMNDPNGLVYHDGVYHYYFQHNPVDREWENMSWAHAVSTDLLHWTHKDIAMLPEADGTIYSGCAIVNEHEALGYPKDAILAFYTVAGGNNVWSQGKKFVQKVAVSCDGGDSLSPLSVGVLPTIADYNRDPNVFWHEESSAYVMVLWIDAFDFAVFRSTDLVTWQETQRITLPEGYECPNMRQLYTEEGESCWIIFDAAGSCYTGEFDGYKFDWSGKVQKLFHREHAENSAAPYAAQLYAGTPDRCVLVPWLTTQDVEKKYHCTGGLPRELYLRKEEDGSFTVCQKPIAEYEEAKTAGSADEATEAHIIISEEENVELTVLTEDGSNLQICYESNGLLIVGDKQYSVAPGLGDIRVLTDDRLVEIFLEDTEYVIAELSESACGFAADEAFETEYWIVK